MNVNVRLSAGLAPLAGNSRLLVSLDEAATVADLLRQLRRDYPAMAQQMDKAVPMIAGRYAATGDRLAPGQDVAILLPVAGGRG
jgi:molybdopterin synthase catalytic subunit/molybdopterin synthase sulfur carrier subunit